MAIDARSESSSPNTSPRISFSLDIHSTNPGCSVIPITKSSPVDSFSNFDFFFENSVKIEPSCSAEELFSQGLLKPKQIEPKLTTLSRHGSFSNRTIPSPSVSPLSIRNHIDNETSKVEELQKEVLITSELKSESKSFWRIKRSSSLHSENSYKKSSFWSLPLLSRSSSTGSVPYTKLSKKDNNNNNNNNNNNERNSKKHARFSTNPILLLSSASQRPPLKMKNGMKHNGNGVRISSMLNGPPPIISTNLFGLGSLFGNGKDKKSRK